MNTDMSGSSKQSRPLATILVTAVVTLALAGSALWYAGYLGPAAESPGAVAETAEGDTETLYTCPMHPQIIQEEPGDCPICGMDLVVKRTSREEQTSSKEREIAYWRAPMDPNEIYDSPGKSAMGMDLVPVYEDELVGGVNVSIDPVTEQNMGIRTATVERGPLSHTIRTYGHLTYDETRISRINLKYNGWIEDLSADFTGQAVKRGEPLFTIYSPELVTAQQDLLEAFRNHRDRPGETNRKVLEAVRKRLSYYDIADAEIRAIEKSGELRQALTIRSPVSGVIIEKEAIEGDYIPAGKTVYKIADLSRIWVEAHIYEFELARVRAGLPVTMTLPYLPSKTYSGEVAYIYPYLQRKTRDVVLRLEFDNPDMELKPDMYADIRILTGEDETGIRIPSRAVLRSGERNIAFVVREPGKFTPREVRLGMPLDDGMVEVLSGLAPGETIVTSGQFLLDSESKLKEAVAKMVPPEPGRGKGEERDDEGFFDELETPSETQGSSGSDR